MPQKSPSRRKPCGRGKQPRAKANAEGGNPDAAEDVAAGVDSERRAGMFTPELGDRFCELVATTTLSLRTICAREGMPSVATILRWLRDRAAFREQYRIAKQEQAELMVEEILEIADDGTNDTRTDDRGKQVVCTDVLQRSKLRVDARKWLASKLLPRKYGDRLEMGGAGGGTKPEGNTGVTLTEAKRQELIARRRTALERMRRAEGQV